MTLLQCLLQVGGFGRPCSTVPRVHPSWLDNSTPHAATDGWPGGLSPCCHDARPGRPEVCKCSASWRLILHYHGQGNQTQQGCIVPAAVYICWHCSHPFCEVVGALSLFSEDSSNALSREYNPCSIARRDSQRSSSTSLMCVGKICLTSGCQSRA